MKKLFLLLLCFFTYIYMEAQTTVTYYFEDFQSGMPQDMTFYDVDGLPIHSSLAGTGLGGWHILRNSFADTNYFIGSTSKFSTPGKANDWMITPQMKIYGKGATLKWRAVECDYSEIRDGYKVYVSTTGKEIEDFKDGLIFSIDEEAYENWEFHTVNLDKYEGELIYIAFVNDSFDKYIISIDDIEVTGPASDLNFSFTTPQMTDNGKANVSVEVTGNCDRSIDACKVCYELEGETFRQEFTGLNLTKGKTITLTMDQSIEVSKGQKKSYKAWIEVNGDNYLPENNTVEGTYFVPAHRVVIEEGTGNWCGNCPMGIVAFEYLDKWYPDNFIGIAIHGGQTGEPMAYDSYMSFLGINMYPMGVVNRQVMTAPATGKKDYSLLGSGFEGMLLQALKEAPDAEISGTAKVTGTEDFTIESKFTARFVRDMENKDYLISLVLTEDSVTAPNGEMYKQHNYFYTKNYIGNRIIGSKEVMENLGGFAGAEQYIPMKYNHVARAVVENNFKGLDTGLPQQLEGGKEYDMSFTFGISKGTVNNIEYTHLIALLLTEKGELVNACKIPLGKVTTGIQSTDSSNSLKVDIEHRHLNVTVAEESSVNVELFGVNGEKLSTQSAFVSKGYQFSFPSTISGLYIVKVTSKTGCITRKIVL